MLYAKPAWQTGPGVPDDGARDVPDLALSSSPTHDPYVIFTGGKSYGFGGTSAAAPVFAAILAFEETKATAGTNGDSSGFGNINPELYGGTGYGSPFPAFHDIVTGNNFVPCIAGSQDCDAGMLGYAAGPGYDLVTGWGRWMPGGLR